MTEYTDLPHGSKKELVGQFPPPDEIPNWKEVSGNQDSPIRYIYVVPKDPKFVGSMVFQGVFKTLTGRDILESEQKAFMRSTLTEGVKITINRLIEQDKLRREQGGFSKEKDEALKQFEIASQSDLDAWEPFKVYYDYWDLLSIKNGVAVKQGHEGNKGNYLLLNAPVATIGENTGFPETLIKGVWEVDQRIDYSKAKEPTTLYGDLLGILQRLGYDSQEMDQIIKNSQLVDAFWEAAPYDHKHHIDPTKQILSKNHKPYVGGDTHSFMENQVELLKFVYKKLKRKERNRLLADRDVFISTGLKAESVEVNGQKASLDTHVEANGITLHYDPETGNMAGDTTKSNMYRLTTKLMPIITPDTRHSDLLALRDITIPRLESAGLKIR